MSDAENEEKPRAFDTFELLTALLLGLTAVAAAVAGMQSGQWGGKQLDAFAEANTLTTKASTQYNEDTVVMNADYSAVARAKEHIITARSAKDPEVKERELKLASYFYQTQLSRDAYEAMELPAKYYVPDPDEADPKPSPAASPSPAPSAAPASPVAAAAEAASEAQGAAGDEDIPEAALLASLNAELDHDYAKEMLAGGTAKFAEADKKFAEGRIANENGDQYELVGVLLTVSLFFAGLGLVFKTNIRWGFWASGVLIFGGAVAYMLRLPWCS